MSKRMVVSISHRGISILYKCFHLPDYGKKCKDRFTDKCYQCKFCRAEMKGEDATRLMNRYKKGEENGIYEGKPRWIPVTERLPEKNDNYLITHRLPWKSETGEDRYEVDMDYWQWHTWDDDNDVVAWMPLPDPYEVEE